MKKSDFTVIDGGLSVPVSQQKKLFVSAYVTDTRLMGVIVVCIRWKLDNDFPETDYYQFFYFDCEEYGFETYKSIVSDNRDAVELVERTLIGGLGGRKASISKKQAFELVKKYARFNRLHDIELPGKQEEYEFILASRYTLTPEQQKALDNAQCGHIVTDYQAINYFMMRMIGHDYEGAAYLCEGQVLPEVYKWVYEEHPMASLCRNVIDEKSEGVFLCESLISYDEKNITLISEIEMRDLKVVSFRKCSSFRISSTEAGMMLAKSEFVTLYELMMPPEEATVNLIHYTGNAMISHHDNGRLLMLFNKNNNHVASRIFLLSNDVFGLYFVTDCGQLIVAAYNINNIQTLERELRKSPLAPYLMTVSKFEFKEPVVYEFMQSQFDDFNDFLDVIIDRD